MEPNVNDIISTILSQMDEPTQKITISKKRSQKEIMFDILDTISVLNQNGDAIQTQIMSKSNISYRNVKTYLNHLETVNLIAETSHNRFRITNRGQLILSLAKFVQKSLGIVISYETYQPLQE